MTTNMVVLYLKAGVSDTSTIPQDDFGKYATESQYLPGSPVASEVGFWFACSYEMYVDQGSVTNDTGKLQNVWYMDPIWQMGLQINTALIETPDGRALVMKSLQVDWLCLT